MSDDIENQEELGDDWAAALAEQEVAESKPEAKPKEKPKAAPAPMDELTDEPGARFGDEDANLDVILDIPVTLSMELGRTKINIRNLLQLNQGSVVELDRLAGEPLDVLVNGTLVAHGEVVVVNERFGIRLTDVVSPAERVKKLK
jgi:flagellar motor switch protein FliN/FliY